MKQRRPVYGLPELKARIKQTIGEEKYCLQDAVKIIERMEIALMVIHTWASCDLKYSQDYPHEPLLLDPVGVMDQCNKGLGLSPGENR